MPLILETFRATNYIRKNTDVSNWYEKEPYNIAVALEAKRAERVERAKNKKISWNEVKEKIFQKSSIPKEKLRQHFREFVITVKDIVGIESSEEMLDATSIFLIEAFLMSEFQETDYKRQIKGTFRSAPNSSIESAKKLIADIFKTLPEEEQHSILRKEDDNELLKEPFGHKIKVAPPYKLDEDYEPSSDEEEESANNNLLSSKEATSQSNQASSSFSLPPLEVEEPKVVYNKAWLKNQVACYFEDSNPTTGLSINEIVQTIIGYLNTSSINELQGLLFELLGCERIELIEEIVKHKSELLSNLLVSATKKLENKKIINAFERISGTNQRTFVPAKNWVIVQTEKEKQLQKLIRKEQKKSQHHNSNSSASTGNAQAASKKFNFEPEYAKQQRMVELVNAQKEPLFPARALPIFPKENYPFVFDSMAKAKLSAAYIAGARFYLPHDIEKNLNERYEEIKVPPKMPSEIPPELKKNKIMVSCMDDLGRRAFADFERLNLIQSVLYNAAYFSNENLLVCAPTGAGKTNVAMLSILHCIKQNMEGDTVLKDKFKIVYVAPMKALAAEMVRTFQKRLACLGLLVKELTGDMQLTKKEIMQTQMIVTTPEKWDVVTRKATGDVSLSQLVRLLIFDEVHLLHGDRGPVVETLVARTLRQVESSQTMIRIVGLSATLPNYIDVANFLRVNPYKGLFFFDDRFRPIPLTQRFIGIKGDNALIRSQNMEEVCYEKVHELARRGHQVMVFVHARNSTIRTATTFKDFAVERHQIDDFLPEDSHKGTKEMESSRNHKLKELYRYGFGIHHAGMLRSDRNLVERLFEKKMIRVLFCTATLAWGVNLPAHAVIIKGTEIYDAKHGSFVDIGILDVLQIFGRAGRPQFDKEGIGIIMTTHDKLSKYLSLLTNQVPIESQFINNLADNLNAEISLGTVSNIDEAVEWLSYTYLFVRMRKNPLAYGLKLAILERDPQLFEYRRLLVMKAAEELNKCRMIRYDQTNGYLYSIDVGRIASNYYIKHDTVEVFNEEVKDMMTEAQILALISKADEFEQLKVREEEINELYEINDKASRVPLISALESTEGKVNTLIQAYISRYRVETFSLVSDQNYIIQNATRISRALFEMALKQNKALMTSRFLTMAKMIENQMWHFDTPLHQFPNISFELLQKVENRRLTLDHLREMPSGDIGRMIHNQKLGPFIKECARNIPYVELDTIVQPITQEVLRITVSITPDFRWTDKYHYGNTENFWLWIANPDDNFIHHSEAFILTKEQVKKSEVQTMVFTIPIQEPRPHQYILEVASDRWLHSSVVHPVSFEHLILPESHPPHTNLLNLDPLPVSVLKNPSWEQLFKFSHFNPIQTQIFHTLFHTDANVLVGAPTGSGKTVLAELAFFRVFQHYPDSKIVYIAPLKALVKERIRDWSERLEKRLGKVVVELTGDFTPDVKSIMAANIIVTTPEKWDGVSRSWQTRNYVKAVSLIVIDEIHLLGEDRGPVLEVIVSRTNFIGGSTQRKLRIIGLSTALANSRDLADWLRIEKFGVYNFRSSVRPVPLEIHVAGFPGRHYCPRMALMNKPTFQAIKTHSPTQPALIFVSSRRQTRFTALDLIAYLAAEENPRQWLHMDEAEMDQLLLTVRDQNLKFSLAFGIGLHHAGLQERDRTLVERLFVEQKIQVLVATATLAWGVNLPAHLVVIKGTEYYDAKTSRYVDFPITDVLQMMGRAGRPQYDNEGVAVVLVHDIKKHFYMKFLHNPFPVESSLLSVLPDHLNAEIVSGTVQTKQQCLDYLTWTYFFRRLLKNPSYYGFNKEVEDINKYLSSLVDRSLATLEKSFCVTIGEDERTVEPTVTGKIASYYYLHHKTVEMFRSQINAMSSLQDLLHILTEAHEYSEFPVRHNEDQVNEELAKHCPLNIKGNATYNSPHTKAFLLLQAHFSRLELPMADYHTDLKSVLDQAIRILQAMIDISSDQGWLATTLRIITILQMVLQAHWIENNPLLTLPGIRPNDLPNFRMVERGTGSMQHFETIPELVEALRHRYESLANMLRPNVDEENIEKIFKTLMLLPMCEITLSLVGWWEGSVSEEEKKIPIDKNRKGTKGEWIKIHADQQYHLHVNLKRLNHRTQKDGTKAVAPKFSKLKEEGWFLVLGEIEKRELWGLKRCGYLHHSASHKIQFYSPSQVGRYIYTLFLMSDCYVGLDQQYDIYFEVVEPCIESQVNTELVFDSFSDDQEDDSS